jgi:hypothetical protein
VVINCGKELTFNIRVLERKEFRDIRIERSSQFQNNSKRQAVSDRWELS